MIGRLTGNAEIADEGTLIMDCHGVGYLVACSSRTLALARENPNHLVLYTTMLVRDDGIQLFGFSEKKEQHWFSLLQKIPGVGPRLSLQILSAIAPHFPGYYVARNDESAFLAVSGVGKKLAFRLVSELKTHIVDELSETHQAETTHPENPLIADAASALINLGYAKSDAEKAVEKAWKETNTTLPTSQLIKLALQEIRRISS